MFSIFGFEYYSIGDACMIQNETLSYDGLASLFVWSFGVVCAFALLKVECRWWHAQGARQYAMRQCGGNTEDLKFVSHHNKFIEQGWKVQASAFRMFVGLYVVFCSGEVNASELRSWNSRWPQRHTASMEWYYRIALGYTMFRMFTQFFEERRKDFLALVIHHWFTFGLIVFSKMAQMTETGVLVLVIHDNGDMLLATSKLLTYSGKNWLLLRDAVFAVFAFSWIAVRICAYSYFVLLPYMAAVEYSCHVFYWPCVIPNFGLLLLHFYWLVPILRIARGIIQTGGEVGDVRSDEERFQHNVANGKPKTN